MKNKVELKKCLALCSLLIILFSIGFIVLKNIEYKKYCENLNDRVNGIIISIKKEYPNVSDKDIIGVINDSEKSNKSFLEKYGILNEDTIFSNNELIKNNYLVINILYLILSISVVVFIFLKYILRKDKELSSITNYLKEINKKNYKLDLNSMSEDELSILKNEIYKTTVMLREQRDNSVMDKIQLKDSLSLISHQIKTPLTSIMIMLDNIIDTPDMDEEIKNDFIMNIKMEINNINFLVQTILKISKFDSNTIKFNNKKNSVNELIESSIKKVLPLSDLKDIKINVNVIKDDNILCDSAWQKEALSNILKNCLEHSYEHGNIDISIDTNDVYSLVTIKDYGRGISKDNLKHIFEKYYNNSSNINSVGLGLYLSNMIIRKNNGIVDVSSVEGENTCFTIKYYKI